MGQKAQIVVGMGYGDEGKGITTDYLCSQATNPIVIRYSGGQQAGHTVMIDGVKHIHSNFGSGALRGIPTYFSEHTTFYPTTIWREMIRLKEKGVQNSILVIHPLAKMTTPWDVFSNRADSDNLEDGSCGLGIGKTMKRNVDGYQLTAIDLLNKNILVDKIESIRENYYKYSVDPDPPIIEQEEMDTFFQALQEIEWKVEDYEYMYTRFDTLIFEGSQGVLLDKDFGVFPHVTYANTTSKNAHEICDKLGIRNRELFYVTRSYHTRHGNGPFMERKLDLVNDQEEINVFNHYQGRLKKSPLRYDLLNQAIRIDSLFSSNWNKTLVVTCIDQIPGFSIDSDKLDTSQFDKMLMSMSPDSKDFMENFYFK